ncbi:MAG TPA: hypothetical protein VIX35_05440 [Vicinamibacterales bacterium]
MRELEPGTQIIVTANGSQLGERYVLSTSESGITMLNLADPTLPARAREVLRHLAEHSPALFADAQQGGTFPLEKNVRLMSQGVFVADRKVADLGRLVDTVARADIFEITEIAGVKHARNALRGALIGAIGGGAIGYVTGACKSNSFVCLRGLATIFIAGLGAAVGAVVGAAVGRPKVTVIYRVP